MTFIPKYLLSFIFPKWLISKPSFSNFSFNLSLSLSLLIINKSSTHVAIIVIPSFVLFIYKHGSLIACLNPCFLNSFSTSCLHKFPASNVPYNPLSRKFIIPGGVLIPGISFKYTGVSCGLFACKYAPLKSNNRISMLFSHPKTSKIMIVVTLATGAKVSWYSSFL